MDLLRNLNTLANGRRVLGTPYVGLLAAQIAAETAAGDQGPGLLYDESIDPANAGKRLRLRITAWPSAGTLYVAENGAALFSGAPDGTYTAVYAVDADGSQIKTDTAIFSVGSVSVTAPGVTLTGTASLIPGAAAGQQNSTAAGATLVATAMLIPGTATVNQPGTAPGVTLTVTATLAPGSATGTNAGDAAASGSLLIAAATLVAGAAAATQSPTAAGVTLTASATFIPGSANNGQFVLPAARQLAYPIASSRPANRQVGRRPSY